ncbi:MAG: dihydroxyacetone kinase subunit DhaL [Actinomycetota bacterium]
MTAGHDDFVTWVSDFAAQVAENKQYLTKLDSAIGDGDHGTNMDRGMRAVMAKLEGVSGDDIGALLKTIGMTLVSKVGGAGGPLYGTLFMQMATATTRKSDIGAEEWGAALEAAVRGVQTRGKAEPGDKTMLDALIPARDAFMQAVEEGASFADALERSAGAAEEGMKATIPLVARKGRASYLGERSAGHQDPGATSSHLLLRTAANALSKAAS